jgi:hypothetical protein
MAVILGSWLHHAGLDTDNEPVLDLQKRKILKENGNVT